MKINLDNGNYYSWSKYVNYQLKEINEISYLVPNLSIQNLQDYVYNPFDKINDTLVDLLNIGKYSLENDSEDKLNEMILDFTNNYGLLGFMNDTPLNHHNYIYNYDVWLKEDNFVTKELMVKSQVWLKLFFPLLTEKEIEKKIDAWHKILFTDGSIELKNFTVNQQGIFANGYYEPTKFIIKYAQYMYSLLLATTQLRSTDEKYQRSRELIEKFTVDELRISLTIANSATASFTKMRWDIISLKQAIDVTFALLISSDINTLNICKHCKKTFIAKNPKAEYCSPQCRNQANVYKSRNKNK